MRYFFLILLLSVCHCVSPNSSSERVLKPSEKSVVIKKEEGWQKLPWGKWRYLVNFAQTDRTFEEVEVEAYNKTYEPLFFFQEKMSFLSFHVTSGNFDFFIDEKTAVHCEKDDLLLVSPKVQVSFKSTNVLSRMDITRSSPVQISTPFFEKIAAQHIDEHVFKVRGGGLQRFKVLIPSEKTKGTFTRLLFYVEGNTLGPPFHSHSIHETFRILSGQGSIEVNIGGSGKNKYLLEPGDYANVYPKTIHTYRKLGNDTIGLIATLAPHGLEEMFLAYSLLYKQLQEAKIDETTYFEGIAEARKKTTFITPEVGSWD